MAGTSGSTTVSTKLERAIEVAMRRNVVSGAMAAHMGSATEDVAGNHHRNSYSEKTVIADTGKLALPRDRDWRFYTVLIGKCRRRFVAFDKIIAICTRWISTREIASI